LICEHKTTEKRKKKEEKRKRKEERGKKRKEKKRRRRRRSEYEESKGVNPIRFPGFWPKMGTRTGVPWFFVLGNQNQNRDPGKTRVPITGQFRLYLVW
jgi:hypothetical protein